MSLIVDLLETANAQLLNNMRKAKNIIQKYTSNSVPFNDFLLRVAAFSNGISVPSHSKPDEINIIPVLDELVSVGLVQKRPSGAYKRGEALSKLIATYINTKTNDAVSGNLSKDGRLTPTQMVGLSHMAGEDQSIVDKLKNAPKTYKQGGKYSGIASEILKKYFMENDENYKNISSQTKDMIKKLSSLPNPSFSFKILKFILNVQKQKKSYTTFVQLVTQFFKNEEYISALHDLFEIGILNATTNTINNSSIQEIRNVISYMQSPIDDPDLTNLDRVRAFLPRFLKEATDTSATTNRNINAILLNPRFKPILNFINTKLSEDEFQQIISLDMSSLDQNDKIIKYLAKAFNSTSIVDLKQKIEQKYKNRQDFKSDENISAKNIGRFEEFEKIFQI